MSLLWTILYVAFAAVAVWLLAEVLLQYKARLRWRLLAFGGFAAVVVGVVLLSSVVVIMLGAAAFAVGQTFVTLSYRRGFAAGWALGGMPGTSRRRRERPPAEPEEDGRYGGYVQDAAVDEPPAPPPEPPESPTSPPEPPDGSDRFAQPGPYAAAADYDPYGGTYGYGGEQGDQYELYGAHPGPEPYGSGADLPLQPQYGNAYGDGYGDRYAPPDLPHDPPYAPPYDPQYAPQYGGEYGDQYAAASYGAPVPSADGYGAFYVDQTAYVGQTDYAGQTAYVGQTDYADYAGRTAYDPAPYAGGPDPYGEQPPADGTWVPQQRDGEPVFEGEAPEQQPYRQDGYGTGPHEPGTGYYEYDGGSPYGDQQPRY